MIDYGTRNFIQQSMTPYLFTLPRSSSTFTSICVRQAMDPDTISSKCMASFTSTRRRCRSSSL